MTSLERTLAVLQGRLPDRVPVALHNFLMAARLAGQRLPVGLQDGDLLAEAQLAAWRAFGHDALLVESGTTAMSEAFGCVVTYPEQAAPRVLVPAVPDLRDVDRLRVPDPGSVPSLARVLRAVARLRHELGDQVFIMGRADQAPMALAACLRGYQAFLTDLLEPDSAPALDHLLDLCLEATTRYALALRDAGAHGTCVGELGADVVSPALYRQHAVPRLQGFFAAMRTAAFPAGLHQCGRTTPVLPDMVASGATFLELDPRTEMTAVRQAARGRVAVLGMVDPAAVLHLGTFTEVTARSREALTGLAPGGGFVLGPGCALVPETPTGNVAALVAAAAEHGRYATDGTLIRRQGAYS